MTETRITIPEVENEITAPTGDELLVARDPADGEDKRLRADTLATYVGGAIEPTLQSYVDDAEAAALVAETARDAALLSKGLWPTTAAGIGNGIAGVTLTSGGSGGTNGTFALAFSGGTQVLAPAGVFTVVGGAVVSVTITYAGYYSAGTPTLVFTASAGLTGTNITAVMAANTNVNEYFSVPVAGSNDMLILYRVDSGPVATEIARYYSTAGVDNRFLAAMGGQDENIYYKNNVPEYLSRVASTVDNGNGTFTVNTVFVETVYNAVGRLAVGKKCSLSVRVVSGGLTVAQTYVRFMNGASQISIHPVSSTTDADGYYNVQDLTVPALCTTIQVRVDNNTSGDIFEIVFCPSSSTFGARQNSVSRTLIIKNPAISNVPLGLTQVNQAAFAIVRPNATVGLWNALLTSAGSGASSTTLDALQVVEESLRLTGLIDKLIYLNLRCGNDSTACLTPFLDKFGYGKDRTPTSFTFTEANGMDQTAVNVDTGVVPVYCGMGRYGVSLGAYLLNNVTTSSTPLIIASGLTLNPLNSGFHIFDAFNTIAAGGGRTQAGPGNTITAGFLAGARSSDGIGKISKNAEIVATQVTQGGAVPTVPLNINFSRGTSAGDFFGLDMTADDLASMCWILHTFNTALSRAATTEGLF